MTKKPEKPKKVETPKPKKVSTPKPVNTEDRIDRRQTAGGRRQTSKEQVDSLDRFYKRLTGEEPPKE